MATKRRGNGEGSIFRRADGIWAAKIANGYDTNGKRRRKTVYGKTKKEVQEKLLELQQRQKLGTVSTSASVTVSSYLARWLEEAARPSIRPSTHERYGIIIRKQINPYIGGAKLERLTPLDVQTFYNDLERDGVSPRLRQFSHAVLRRALKQACRWGLVARNVCELVTPPKVPKKEVSTLNAEQAKALLEAAKSDRLYALYVLAVTTGMRQGELFGLKWGDIDLEAATLSVRRTTVVYGGRVTTGEPKTAKSKRLIDLPAIAVEALRKREKLAAVEGHSSVDWVFCAPGGGLQRANNFTRRSFVPLLANAGIERIRFHDLRHTAATLLLTKGVHSKVVQERLGHARIGTTLDTYSHVLPSMQKEAVAHLDRVFKDD